MKEETVYVCEVCGEKHSSPWYAKECEGNHKRIRSAKGQYNRYYDKDGYPERVDITFENGVVYRYKKTCISE